MYFQVLGRKEDKSFRETDFSLCLEFVFPEALKTFTEDQTTDYECNSEKMKKLLRNSYEIISWVRGCVRLKSINQRPSFYWIIGKKGSQR